MQEIRRPQSLDIVFAFLRPEILHLKVMQLKVMAEQAVRYPIVSISNGPLLSTMINVLETTVWPFFGVCSVNLNSIQNLSIRDPDLNYRFFKF